MFADSTKFLEEELLARDVEERSPQNFRKSCSDVVWNSWYRHNRQVLQNFFNGLPWVKGYYTWGENPPAPGPVHFEGIWLPAELNFVRDLERTALPESIIIEVYSGTIQICVGKIRYVPVFDASDRLLKIKRVVEEGEGVHIIRFLAFENREGVLIMRHKRRNTMLFNRAINFKFVWKR